MLIRTPVGILLKTLLIDPCRRSDDTAAPPADAGPREDLLLLLQLTKPPHRLIYRLYLPGRPNLQTRLRRCISERPGSAKRIVPASVMPGGTGETSPTSAYIHIAPQGSRVVCRCRSGHRSVCSGTTVRNVGYRNERSSRSADEVLRPIRVLSAPGGPGAERCSWTVLPARRLSAHARKKAAQRSTVPAW